MSIALNIAVSGLNDASARVANSASNIVNASSTGKLPDGNGGLYTGYQPTDIVTLSNSVGDNNLGVSSKAVPRNPAYQPASDPLSPDANAQGLIGVPNVDLASEIVSLKVSQLNYSANAAVIKITDKTEKALLDIKT